MNYCFIHSLNSIYVHSFLHNCLIDSYLQVCVVLLKELEWQSVLYLHFPTSEVVLLDSTFFGVPGVKLTLGEVKVQGSDIAAACENVGEASSFSHPGNHHSLCCFCSRWVNHQYPVLLLAHRYWKSQHPSYKGTHILNNRWAHLQMYTHQSTDTVVHYNTMLETNKRGRLIKHYNQRKIKC